MTSLLVVMFVVMSQIAAVSCVELRKELRQREEEDAVEGCDNYMVLTEADRLEDYFAPNKLKCDWQLMSGWYRFTGGAGTQMANKCMKTGSTACSAIGAGWIVGSLPTVEKGIETRGVCFRTHDSCCSSTMDIKVRNCGNYIVYYLEGPERCPYRYCSTKEPIIAKPKPTTQSKTTESPETTGAPTQTGATTKPVKPPEIILGPVVTPQPFPEPATTPHPETRAQPGTSKELVITEPVNPPEIILGPVRTPKPEVTPHPETRGQPVTSKKSVTTEPVNPPEIILEPVLTPKPVATPHHENRSQPVTSTESVEFTKPAELPIPVELPEPEPTEQPKPVKPTEQPKLVEPVEPVEPVELPEPTKSFSVDCYSTRMVVKLNMAYYIRKFHLAYSFLHLSDPTCGVYHDGKRDVTLVTPLDGCKTERRFTRDRIMFRNKVFGVPLGPGQNNKRQFVSYNLFYFNCTYDFV